MLGFTHQSKSSRTGFNIVNEPNFQPIIITNKLPKQVSPKKQQKYIRKATQNRNTFNQNTQNLQKEKKSKSKQVSKSQWNTGGLVKGAFDKNLRKNDLAAEERRIRAEMKKQKQLIHQEIVVNEKRIGTKAMKMMREKDDQIQYLKQMIENEKKQKAQIDRAYEQKKLEIQRQRQELIQLERRIQKEGIKEKKVIQEIKRISSPDKDQDIKGVSRGKLPIETRMRQKIPSPKKNNFEQPTQSQALHQKNVMRQKQLDYLIHQRQQCIKGVPSLNYSQTLIPLLSKASYKIVSTHVSQIVELLVDDLLQEQVLLLEQIQLLEAKQRQEQKSKNLLNQYYDMVSDFVDQHDQIANKVGKYSTMNFSDLYKPKHYPQKEKRSGFEYDRPQKEIVRKIFLQNDFDEDRMEQIQNRRERFTRFVANFDEYKKSNLDMFAQCTQEIINEAIQKLAKQLDKGSGQFVDIVFRNEFN